jgi:hypothetical protein
VQQVTSQEFWSICRSGDDLIVSVDARIEFIQPKWLRSNANGFIHSSTLWWNSGSSEKRHHIKLREAETDEYSLEQPLSRLRDAFYAIEVFDAHHVWPTSMPADDDWLTRMPNDGPRSYMHTTLRERILAEYERPSSPHISMAEGIFFCHNDDVTSLSVLRFSGNEHIVIGGNCEDVVGREVFQPHVMRLKVFAARRIACNMMVLQDLEPGRLDKTRTCSRHLRAFSLLPNSSARLEILTIR